MNIDPSCAAVLRAALASAAQSDRAPAHQRALGNVALLADILNRRPALNAGLRDEYAHWTTEVYALMGAMAAEPANDAAAPKTAPALQYDAATSTFDGETLPQAAEHWAQWCERRCLGGLPEFLRAVGRIVAKAARHPALTWAPWSTRASGRPATTRPTASWCWPACMRGAASKAARGAR